MKTFQYVTTWNKIKQVAIFSRCLYLNLFAWVLLICYRLYLHLHLHWECDLSQVLTSRNYPPWPQKPCCQCNVCLRIRLLISIWFSSDCIDGSTSFNFSRMRTKDYRGRFVEEKYRNCVVTKNEEWRYFSSLKCAKKPVVFWNTWYELYRSWNQRAFLWSPWISAIRSFRYYSCFREN